MQYPEFTGLQRTSQIIDVLVNDIADRGNEGPEHFYGQTDYYSKQLADLCLSTGLHNNTESPSSITELPRPTTADERIYNSIAGLVLFRGDGEQQQFHQRQLHKAVYGGLQQLIGSKIREEKGKLAEYVCLGLLTRYAHPQMLGYLSLSHHERSSDTFGHYDIGLLCASGEWFIDSYFLQVKGVCFGICEPDKSMQPLAKAQERYRPLYQLLSGCCHLGIRGDGEDRKMVPKMLLHEYEGILEPSEIKQLDNMTDMLLWKISCDELPRGTYKGMNDEWKSGLLEYFA